MIKSKIERYREDAGIVAFPKSAFPRDLAEITPVSFLPVFWISRASRRVARGRDTEGDDDRANHRDQPLCRRACTVPVHTPHRLHRCRTRQLTAQACWLMRAFLRHVKVRRQAVWTRQSERERPIRDFFGGREAARRSRAGNVTRTRRSLNEENDGDWKRRWSSACEVALFHGGGREGR